MIEQILQALSFIGIAISIGYLVYIDRRLEILGELCETMNEMKHDLKVMSDFLGIEQTI